MSVVGQYLVNQCNHYQYSLCHCDVSDKDELTVFSKYHCLKGLDGMWIPTSSHTSRQSLMLLYHHNSVDLVLINQLGLHYLLASQLNSL